MPRSVTLNLRGFLELLGITRMHSFIRMLYNVLYRLDAAKTENKEIAHKLFTAAAEFASYQGESGVEIQTVRI